jgi:hypothetical protein
MKPDELLNDPAAALAAEVHRMLAEAHDAVNAFRDIQSQATLDQNAAAKADLAVLKSNELLRLKARLPQVGTRLTAITAGFRERTDATKTADKMLDAAINAFRKHVNEPHL